jgi:hypothetical protein
MDQAGPAYVRRGESAVLVYEHRSDPGIAGVELSFGPELPHDDDFCWPVGNPC